MWPLSTEISPARSLKPNTRSEPGQAWGRTGEPWLPEWSSRRDLLRSTGRWRTPAVIWSGSLCWVRALAVHCAVTFLEEKKKEKTKRSAVCQWGHTEVNYLVVTKSCSEVNILLYPRGAGIGAFTAEEKDLMVNLMKAIKRDTQRQQSL